MEPEEITEEWVRAEVARTTAPDQNPLEMVGTVMEGGPVGALLMIRQAVAAMAAYSDPDQVTTSTHAEIVADTTGPSYADLDAAVEAMTEAVASLMWRTYICECAECQRQSRADAAPFN